MTEPNRKHVMMPMEVRESAMEPATVELIGQADADLNAVMLYSVAHPSVSRDDRDQGIADSRKAAGDFTRRHATQFMRMIFLPVVLPILSLFVFETTDVQAAARSTEYPLGAANTQSAAQPYDSLPDGGPFLKLNLPAAIKLALNSNRSIQSAYLSRIADEYSLLVAEDRFRPDVEYVIDSAHARSGDTLNRIDTDTASVGPRLSLLLPTGGQLSFTWANEMEAVSGSDREYRSGLDISFVQPLLRGGGFGVNRAPQRIARINERVNVLQLKSTINSTITGVVIAYRQLLLEQQQLDIAERSLARSRGLLKTNRIMIEAGRMARQDIVQTEADVSQRELDLVSVQNTVDSARFALIDTLDIDPETRLTLTDALYLQEIGKLDFQSSYAQALANQPAYLQALLQSEIAKLNVRTAKNEQRWRLDARVNASYGGTSSVDFGSAFDGISDDPADYSVGLQLSIPFGDRSRKQNLINAEVAQRQQDLDLLEIREAVRIDIKDRVRTIQNLRRQVDLAKRAAALAAQQLEIENLKLAQGRSSNFQVLSLEDQLIAAQINEATAQVSYLNALTELDEALGTTMETWHIVFEPRRYASVDQLPVSHSFRGAAQ